MVMLSDVVMVMLSDGPTQVWITQSSKRKFQRKPSVNFINFFVRSIFVRNFDTKNFKPKIQLSYKILAQKMRFCSKNGCRILQAALVLSRKLFIWIYILSPIFSMIIPFYLHKSSYICFFSPFSPKRPGKFWSKDIDKWQL